MATALSPEDVESRLRARFGQDILAFEVQHGHAVATVSTERYRDVCRLLRDEPEFACDLLRLHRRCRLRSGTWASRSSRTCTPSPIAQRPDQGAAPARRPDLPDRLRPVPHVRTGTSVRRWRCSGSTSRVTRKPVKLLLSEPFEGQPLRKDFPLMSREVKPWPGARGGRGRGGRRVILAETGVSVFSSPFSNFWLVLLLKTIAVMGFFLVVPLGVGYMEHKGLAHMQARLGPMEAGGFHGWAQLVADGVKFIQKEDIIPAAADRNVFSLAPAVAMIPYIAILVVLPLGDSCVRGEPRRRHLLRAGDVQRRP